MFEALSDKLQGVFSRLGSRGTITEKDLDDAMREVRLALLEADVNFKVVKDFVTHVRDRATGAEIHKALRPHEQIISFVNEELVATLGQEAVPLNRAAQPPTTLMLVGLQGSGKTTMASKLALYLRARGDGAGAGAWPWQSGSTDGVGAVGSRPGRLHRQQWRGGPAMAASGPGVPRRVATDRAAHGPIVEHSREVTFYLTSRVAA